MIVCPKCGGQLADGTKFCKYCGNPLTQSQVQATNAQSNMQKPVYSNQPKPAAAPQKPRKKKSSKNIVLAIIAVILVIAIAVGGWLLWDVIAEKKKEDLTDEEKLTQILEESTTKPIIEFVYDDYDSDGTYEAYAVVGETDDEDEKHPEFYDADIYFVTHKKAQPIKENVSGQVNDVMDVEDNKYISIEVYENGTDGGKSFIYTVDGTKSVEPDFSGEYSRVREENGKIVGLDENGNEIELDISLLENKDNNKQENAKFLEATDADFETLVSDFDRLFLFRVNKGIEHFDCETYDIKSAINTVLGFDMNRYGYEEYFFDENAPYFEQPDLVKEDPLGKFEDAESPNYYPPENGQVYKTPAENLEWVIENILNMKPDRTLELNDFYYYDGYYYSRWVPFQDDEGSIYTLKMTDNRRLEDGRYEVKLKYTIASPSCVMADGSYVESEIYYDVTFVATVALKEIDGGKYWSFYEFSPITDIPADAVEFNGHYYKVVDDPVGYYDATSYCSAHGGYLCSITSQQEQDFVESLLASGNKNVYWLGGMRNGSWYDMPNSNEWSWNSGEPFTYTNWGENEPNNMNESEYYLQIYAKPINQKVLGDWNDASYDGADYSDEFYSTENTGLICEWDGVTEW